MTVPFLSLKAAYLVHGSRAGAGRGGARRGGGSGEDNAWRTVRRWTWKRRASSRIDSCSRSCAFLICSNSSTFDLVAMDPTVEPTAPAAVERSGEHTQPPRGNEVDCQRVTLD